MKTRLPIVISFVILACALFLLPKGTRERIVRTGRIFVEPSVEFNAMSQRVAREVLGGLPAGMTLEERDELLAELAKTKADLASRDAVDMAIQAENRQLQRLLRYFKEPHDFSLVVAGVADRLESDDAFGTVVLDRGASDGIQAGQAVLNVDGVVGIVLESTTRSAVVRLITSRHFAISAEVTARQVSGIMEECDGALALTSPMGKAYDDLQEGESVYTSALGNDSMVAGLLLGTISGKERGPDDSPRYFVNPAADPVGQKYLFVAIPGGR